MKESRSKPKRDFTSPLTADQRIVSHPILSFKRGTKVSFSFNGVPIHAYEGESIAAALEANGIKELSRSVERGRPRGLFCAIGKCASCLMTVDGIPNVRACLTPVSEGMTVLSQSLGRLPHPSTHGEPEPLVLRKKADVVVLGAGPAGLSAAIAIANAGMQVLVIDESPQIGGQLSKQTHKFFGSVDQYAGVRGVDIARELEEQANSSGVEFSIRSSVLSLTRRQNGQFVMDFNRDDRLTVVETPAVIVATGASERMIPFPNNDLPGVYGAGAVQTLVNIYGVRPGSRVLMVGAGNVGLIVSYQLLQADISVIAVVEFMPRISGYQVHASKLRRCGVPIYTSHSILMAVGSDRVEGAVIAPLGEERDTLEAKARELNVDTICLAVGLSPCAEVLRTAEVPCRMIPELGGLVPLHAPFMATLVDGLYVAGDAAGIGEASTAMVEGKIAAMSAVLRARGGRDVATERARRATLEGLHALRSGPAAQVIAHGKKRVFQAFRSAR